MLSRKVQISGVNTHKLPAISSQRARELFRRLAEGDEEARGELVQGNLRLVLSILQRFKGRGEAVDDLFQVGCIGLLKAVDNFDLSQGVNFSTYAVPMIIGEIKRYLRDNNTIHLSRSLKQMSQKVQQARDKLTRQNLQEPKISEIAAEVDLSPEEVVNAFNASFEPLSLYDPVYNDSTDPVYVMDLISDQRTNTDTWLENLALQEAINRLSPRESQIIRARFFEGKTQMEIARMLDISQAQVSRIEKAAIRFIRQYYQRGQEAEEAGEQSD